VALGGAVDAVAGLVDPGELDRVEASDAVRVQRFL
jgi:hypothetical protein